MTDVTVTFWPAAGGGRHHYPEPEAGDRMAGPPPGYQRRHTPHRSAATPVVGGPPLGKPGDDRPGWSATWSQPDRSPSRLAAMLPEPYRSAVEVVARVNWDHACTAWERRSRDPISPHALLLFYTDLDETGGLVVRTACRMFLAGDEPRLGDLLAAMAQVAREHLGLGHDPRTYMVNWADPMTDQAAYYGIGVSTLDTPSGTWDQLRREAHSDMTVPGYGYLTLGIDTRISVHRPAMRDHGATMTITSNRPVDDAQAYLGRSWRYDRHLGEPAHTHPDQAYVWAGLARLHHTLASAGVPHA